VSWSGLLGKERWICRREGLEGMIDRIYRGFIEEFDE
jgi:hypothetical protein